MQLKNTPPKGTADWFPEEYKKRKYIFDTWRNVCESYGFEEYLGPLVEDTAIWEAKSGEDVGGSELTKLTDKSGEISNLALRPEMTPTVTRMVSRIWKETDKPVKWFSIANFYRNEKPQKGRNREFWQLNCDIFGHDGYESDIEILCLALDLMLAFNPPAESFALNLNHRGLLDTIFADISVSSKTELFRLLDKFEKMPREKFISSLSELGVSEADSTNIIAFLEAKSVQELENIFPEVAQNTHFLYLQKIANGLQELGYGAYVQFSGGLIRGFDYYDGVIFEIFDKNPDNPRALFGGGRYNGLASIFGVKEPIPAVGMAPGDETMKLFLENWGVFDALADEKNVYYLPILDEKMFSDCQKLGAILRGEGKNVLLSLSTKKLTKAMKYCDKNNIKNMIIFGAEELEKGEYRVKDLESGEEEKILI